MAKNKKIVAIMFTSLVDYQKLTNEDSQLALEVLSEHDKILTKLIKKSHGNIIKHINESIFAEFPSATDGVNGAINIQKKLKSANALNPKAFIFFITVFTLVINEDTEIFIKSLLGIYMSMATFIWFTFMSILLTNEKATERFENLYRG